ncbi:MAG: flagellar basal body protein, partial [Gammaproteobacteria bacterium]
MPEVLNIATSGLLTLQRALSTTSNNIVNVNTEGYTRQAVNFETQQSRQTGAGFIGSGVTSSPVERVYNAYLVDQVHLHTASESSLSTMSDMVSRLDNVLADPAGGLNQNIQKFFSAVNSMANNPASSPERRVVISEAEALATQVKYL